MLIGLEVDPNPLVENRHHDTPLEIIYEDPWIVVVNKPAGMLSVPGKNGLDSVLQRLQELYPESDSPLLVHRLDMDTSGLLLAAKDKNIHQCLQALFETRQIRKRYTALLQGNPRQDEGTIDLPLCPDFSDRPRQQVNWELGKKAVTRFRVEERSGGTTRVSFWPLTGRTHQLRVHAPIPKDWTVRFWEIHCMEIRPTAFTCMPPNWNSPTPLRAKPSAFARKLLFNGR